MSVSEILAGVDWAALERTIRGGEPYQLPASLRSWIAEPKQLWVGGKPISVDKLFFETINPATGEILTQVARAQRKEVDRAVESARRVYESGVWSNVSQKDRCEVVRRLGELILEHRVPLALLETLDTGKPIRESLDGDIPRAAHNCIFFSELAAHDELPHYAGPGESHLGFREPVGVVALITPWNLPLYLETWKVAPALVMGNSVILKPSELTPLTAAYLAELIEKAGVPNGAFQLLHGFGENEAGEFLVSHPGVDAISFTGETGTGRSIMRAASVGPTRLSFELGGKGASVIFADAVNENTINETVRAAFRNQGQICLACPRIYIEKPQFENFAREYAARVANIKVGDPLRWETEMGALISEEHRAKVQRYLGAVASPATFLAGHEGNLPARGNFLRPSVVMGLTDEHPICREEVFGPVVSLQSFESEAEVIRRVDSTPYGLSCSLWTKDLDRAMRVGKKVHKGLVWINTWFARNLHVPFGGQKRSGLGREGGSHSLEFFSEWKSICLKWEERL